MEIGDIEITWREAIFSVTIASILFIFGFLIASAIEHYVNQRTLEYRQAAQIENNPSEFALALKTDLGNAFVEGDFYAVDPVQHKDLRGKWTSIYAEHQKYTQHTRIVHYTTTDSKGKTRTKSRTETYWTWDTYDTESLNANTVNFSGVEFPFSKVRFSWRCRHSETVKTGYHRRIVFDCVRPSFHASTYAKLEGGTIPSEFRLYGDISLATLYEDFTTSYAVVVFWVCWGALMLAAVVAFVVLENRWLENN